MSIAADLIRGHTETIILARLAHHDSYGYEINKAIQQKTAGQYEFKEATMYAAFRRLEASGDIASYWGNESTGARRRYYAITTRGRLTLARLKAEWATAKDLIDTLIAEEVSSHAD